MKNELVRKKAVIANIWALWNEQINDSTKYTAEETAAITRAFKYLQKKIEDMPTDFDLNDINRKLRAEKTDMLKTSASIEEMCGVERATDRTRLLLYKELEEEIEME